MGSHHYLHVLLRQCTHLTALVRFHDIEFSLFECKSWHFEYAAVGAGYLNKAFRLIEKAPVCVAPAARAGYFTRSVLNVYVRHAMTCSTLMATRTSRSMANGMRSVHPGDGSLTETPVGFCGRQRDSGRVGGVSGEQAATIRRYYAKWTPEYQSLQDDLIRKIHGTELAQAPETAAKC